MPPCDLAQLGGAQGADGLEIMIGEMEIAGGEPIGAEILGLALHGFAGGESAGNELFDGFPQFSGRYETFLEAFDFGQNGNSGGLELVGIGDGADSEEAGVTRVIGPGIDGMGEALSFANGLVESGAASGAEQGGEDVEGGDIGVAEVGDMPGAVGMSQFDVPSSMISRKATWRGSAATMRGGRGLALAWAKAVWSWSSTASVWTSPTTTKKMLLGM